MYTRYIELLEKHNLTTSQVCKDTGIPMSTISSWGDNNRNSNLSAENTFILSRYFNVPFDYFIKPTEKMKNVKAFIKLSKE